MGDYEIAKPFDLSPEGLAKARRELLKESNSEPKKKSGKKHKDCSGKKAIKTKEDEIAVRKKKEEDLLKKEEMKKLKAKKDAEKIRAQKEEERRQAEIDIIQLIARRDMLRNKLSDLNPGKQKDAIKIASINIELNDINRAIETIRREYGISMDHLNQGSGIKRFFGKVKSKACQFAKKVKKFFKRNTELITGVAAIVLPVFGSLIATKLAAAAA